MKTTKTAAEINEIMNELVSYTELQDQLKAQIESLQDEIKLYLTETETDEFVAESGSKCTWRETVSNRFATTEFKKAYASLYASFTKKTTYKRFTLNR